MGKISNKRNVNVGGIILNPIEVKIPKDIKEYKEKIILGLSARQLISVIISLSCGAGAFFLFRKIISIRVFLVYVIIAFASPAIAFGFGDKNGYHLEQRIRIYANFYINRRKKIYKTELIEPDNYQPKKNIKREKKKELSAHQIECIENDLPDKKIRREQILKMYGLLNESKGGKK